MGEVTLTDLVGKMIDNSNKLPSKDILEKINGIAFRKSDDFPSTQIVVKLYYKIKLLNVTNLLIY